MVFFEKYMIVDIDYKVLIGFWFDVGGKVVRFGLCVGCGE